MVKVFPFASFRYCDKQDSVEDINGLPNRFNTSSYDRSVFEPEGCIGAYNKCKCFRCEKRPVAAFSENLDSIVQFDINLRNIQEYIDGKILHPFGENSFILYEQSCATHKQRGICVALDILDFVKGNVFRHENTIASPVARAHKYPISKDPLMIMYQGDDEIQGIIDSFIANNSPIMSFTVDDVSGHPGLHRIWVMSSPEVVNVVERYFTSINSLYIADGHHRCESACHAYESFVNRGKPVPANMKYVMAYLYSVEELQVLPFHRCLRSMCGNEGFSEQLLAKLSDVCDITECDSDEVVKSSASELESMYLYLANSWRKLVIKPEYHLEDDPVRSLHIQILLDEILVPLLGDQLPMHLDYLPGKCSMEELSEMTDNNTYCCVFAVPGIPVEKIILISDAGMLLPPKATCFDPKPLVGLVNRIL